MRSFKLPERFRKFLVPGALLLAIFLFAGGLYFRRRGLLFSSQNIETEEGEGAVSGVQTGVPENFPEDIPLFEPAEIVSSLESQERIQATLQTDASAGRVSQFYQQKMKDLGWQLTGRGVSGDNGVLTFVKAERRVQLVITSDPEGPTLIILNTNP